MQVQVGTGTGACSQIVPSRGQTAMVRCRLRLGQMTDCRRGGERSPPQRTAPTPRLSRSERDRPGTEAIRRSACLIGQSVYSSSSTRVGNHRVPDCAPRSSRRWLSLSCVPNIMTSTPRACPNVLMLGTGEYTTGFTGQGASDSDKSTGVVALVMLDLQRRGKVGKKLGMCGTDGRKLPAIRAHMQRALGDMYAGINPSSIETWPADGVVDRDAYKEAIACFQPGDVGGR